MKVNTEKFKNNMKKELSSRLQCEEAKISYSHGILGHEFSIIKNEADIIILIGKKRYGNHISLTGRYVNEEMLRHLKTLSEFINDDELLEDIRRKSISETPSHVSLLLGE